MPQPVIPQWAKFVGVTILGVFGGAFAAGIAVGDGARDVTDARRVADEAVAGVVELRPRMTTLELWRAAKDERDLRIEELLIEVRADVKSIKGR